MAETTETINPTAVSQAQPESEDSTSFSKTTDPTAQEEATDLKKEAPESEKKPGGISLRIWPPTEKTRDAVSNRLIETLSTESILSKRYGILTSEEAATVAKSIEEEAYDVASGAVTSYDDGIKVLEIYSKEISRLMLESVKARSNVTVGNDNDLVDDDNDNAKTEDSKDDVEDEKVVEA